MRITTVRFPVVADLAEDCRDGLGSIVGVVNTFDILCDFAPREALGEALGIEGPPFLVVIVAGLRDAQPHLADRSTHVLGLNPILFRPMLAEGRAAA